MPENSRPNRSLPSPTPSTSRPPLSRSSVTVSRATLAGRRRASGVTIGPSRSRSVDRGRRGQRDPRVGHLADRRAPVHVVPDEEAVPARLLGLGGQPDDHGGVGELVEQGQPQRGAHGHDARKTRWIPGVPVSVQNMGTTSPDLYLAVDRGRGVRAQVEAGIRAAVRGGRLPAGTRLPSTRALAADLGVTRRVVVEAYDQLAAEGYVSARRARGPW